MANQMSLQDDNIFFSPDKAWKSVKQKKME